MEFVLVPSVWQVDRHRSSGFVFCFLHVATHKISNSRFWNNKSYADCFRRKRQIGFCSLLIYLPCTIFLRMQSKQHTKSKFLSPKSRVSTYWTNNTSQSSSIGFVIYYTYPLTECVDINVRIDLGYSFIFLKWYWV